MSCSASGTYSLPSAFMKSYCVSTSQKITRGMNLLLWKDRQRGNLSAKRGGVNYCEELQRQCYGHLVAGVLPGTARAIGPDFEGELLFLGDAEAEAHEEQRFAGQAEHLVQTQRACVDDQCLYERFADAAALLVVAHGEPGNFGELGAVDLEVAAEVVVRPRQEITGRDERRHQDFHRGDVGEGGGTERRLGLDR